jgi:hypothetical protein
MVPCEGKVVATSSVVAGWPQSEYLFKREEIVVEVTRGEITVFGMG